MATKIKQSIMSRCQNTDNNPTPIVFNWSSNIKPIIYDNVGCNNYYTMAMYSNINVVEDILPKISVLKDNSVQSQTLNLTKSIIKNLCFYADAQVRLPKISLTEQSDNSVLIEWNFENFRIGFSLEPDENETSLYIIEKDDGTNYLKTETRKIGSDIEAVVKQIISFVVRNS